MNMTRESLSGELDITSIAQRYNELVELDEHEPVEAALDAIEKLVGEAQDRFNTRRWLYLMAGFVLGIGVGVIVGRAL